MKISFWLKFLTVLVLLISCNNHSKDVDVSEIEIDFKFFRFEHDLKELLTDADANKIGALKKKYGIFFDRFNENMIQIGSSSRADYRSNIANFLNDAAIKTVFADVEKEYSNTSTISAGFEDAFKHYRYYFPTRLVPHVLTFISGFNYPMAVTDSVLAIGLDMYLGKKYAFYKMMSIPQYQVDYMSGEYIVTDAMRAWLQTEFETMEVHTNLLNEIIFAGKLSYALDYILPQAEDSVKMEFSSNQLQWATTSEVSIWKYFIDKNLFYSTKASENAKYINPAPFTAGMPKESPGRVGMWLGYKIVNAYMEKNPGVTLEQLMLEKNAQKILNESHYKPKK